MLLAGCASTKASKFYTLNSMAGPGIEQRSVTAMEGIIIEVGPVEIPGILDRPQIVFYSGSNELEFSEFDRWAGPLRNDIYRVLIDDLSLFFSKNDISVVSWRQALSADYRIDFHITKFGRVSDKEVVLAARWTVFKGGEKKAVYLHESSLNEHIEGRGHSAVVAAMSRSIEKLSREVADVFLKFIIK